MTTIIDLDGVSALIRDAAAREIMPRWRHLEQHQIREKKPGDLVTEADIACEAVLTRKLTELLPGSAVVGEEAVAADPAVMDRLSRDAPTWIIDPVDGTANFARGSETFGVIVALAQGGKTLAGWIYDPVKDRMAVAELGKGTKIDGHAVTLGNSLPLSQVTGYAGCKKAPALSATGAKLVRLGSAAHDYLSILDKRSDFACFKRSMPWDHAAGILMILEAGGYSALIDGRTYAPFPWDASILNASSRQRWDEVRALLPAG